MDDLRDEIQDIRAHCDGKIEELQGSVTKSAAVVSEQMRKLFRGMSVATDLMEQHASAQKVLRDQVAQMGDTLSALRGPVGAAMPEPRTCPLLPDVLSAIFQRQKGHVFGDDGYTTPRSQLARTSIRFETGVRFQVSVK